MLTARCQEPGCSWVFTAEDKYVMWRERDTHFEAHCTEPQYADNEQSMGEFLGLVRRTPRRSPRYAMLSDDNLPAMSPDNLAPPTHNLAAAYGATLFGNR